MGEHAPGKARTVLLLRHGESDYNAAGLMQGASYRPRLTDTGRAQALQAQSLLPARVDALLVSPLTRAVETANTLRKARPDLPPGIVVPELREIDLPEWEGRGFADLDRDDGARRAAWRRDPESLTMRGHDGRIMQPCDDAFVRAAAVIDRLHARPDGTTVVVVAHGGILRAVMALLFGLPRARLHVLPQDNASAHRLRLEPDGARLLAFGETAGSAEARVLRALAIRGPLVALAPVAVAPVIAKRAGLRLAAPDETPGPEDRVVIPGDASARQAALARFADIPAGAAAALTPHVDGIHALVPEGPRGPATITLLDAPAASVAGLAKEI